jgi:hypothetical protein
VQMASNRDVFPWAFWPVKIAPEGDASSARELKQRKSRSLRF